MNAQLENLATATLDQIINNLGLDSQDYDLNFSRRKLVEAFDKIAAKGKVEELNPNHPVTRELHDHWYKIAAILLFKSGQTRAEISADDIDRFMASGRANITMHSSPKSPVIRLELVTDAEAAVLARREGGLTV